MTNGSLPGLRILVVEDEYFLMEDLCRTLTEAGAVIVGPAPSNRDALALLGREPAIDAAVLDVNLGGEMAFPVADALIERAIPFVFVTGYGDGRLDRLYPDVPRHEKPTDFRGVARSLARLVQGGA